MPVTEAVFENGVLKPVVAAGFKEHQRYHLIWQEATPPTIEDPAADDPELAAELERRTTLLPDGSAIINLGGIFEPLLANLPDDADEWERAFAEVRQDRARHFDEEWPELPDATQE